MRGELVSQSRREASGRTLSILSGTRSTSQCPPRSRAPREATCCLHVDSEQACGWRVLGALGAAAGAVKPLLRSLFTDGHTEVPRTKSPGHMASKGSPSPRCLHQCLDLHLLRSWASCPVSSLTLPRPPEDPPQEHPFALPGPGTAGQPHLAPLGSSHRPELISVKWTLCHQPEAAPRWVTLSPGRCSQLARRRPPGRPGAGTPARECARPISSERPSRGAEPGLLAAPKPNGACS